MPFTKGFNNSRALALHFVKHGGLLGANSEAEYLAMADTFLGGPLEQGALECARASDQNLLRFREPGQRFGVLFRDKVICTFYRLGPPPRDVAWFRGKCAA